MTAVAAATAPTTLYRSLLREARKVKDYNFRSYALRRVKTDFVANRELKGGETTNAINQGLQHLDMLKRQSALSQLYPSVLSVME
eukprot:scaffold41806_cov49-Attheya_sp.AAC.3